MFNGKYELKLKTYILKYKIYQLKNVIKQPITKPKGSKVYNIK